MKKILMLLVVTMLLLGVKGQAMASFANGDLIRVVYSTSGTMETATDLGSISSLTSASTTNVVYNANNFNLSALGGTADASNSYVAYYSITLAPSPANQAWVSGPLAGVSKASKTQFASAYLTGVGNTNGMYDVASGGAKQVTVLMSDPNSYWMQLNRGGSSIGRMNNFLSSGYSAEASLAGLSTVGYVDQTIYYYGSLSGAGTATGLNVATIRTYADGHTALNPSAVPIPAAVYLFGSGLLSLVGIRRKTAA